MMLSMELRRFFARRLVARAISELTSVTTMLSKVKTKVTPAITCKIAAKRSPFHWSHSAAEYASVSIVEALVTASEKASTLVWRLMRSIDPALYMMCRHDCSCVYTQLANFGKTPRFPKNASKCRKTPQNTSRFSQNARQIRYYIDTV